jgi:hypothetical protein
LYRVFLIILADFGEVVFDVDASIQLVFEVGFKVLLLTASFTQVQRGKIRGDLGGVMRQLF